MRKATVTLISVVAAFGILGPAGAVAGPYLPDGSGLDQYVESLPGAGGNNTGSAGGRNGSNPGGKPAQLPSKAKKSLVESGEAGRATALVAETTAPTGSTRACANCGVGKPKKGEDSGRTDLAGNLSSANTDKQSPLAAAFSAGTGNSDDSGMGILLPVLLAASLVMAIAIGAGRFRRRDGLHSG